MRKPVMRIGELASRTGISTSALRYYEEAGLLEPVERTETGYRAYGLETIGRVQFVQRAKALGLSLREVRQLLANPHADVGAERDGLRHLVAHKIAETEGRITELQALERELESLYVRLARAPGPDCGHIGDCACWLPTKEEVMKMVTEIAGTESCTCCGCSEPGCDCGCSCCGQG